MNTPQPFFLLAGRASVFWLGAIAVFIVSMMAAGLTRPDERLGIYVDPAFFAVFALPAFAGWLAGAMVREFQHTTFAALLPNVRIRIASGFLISGLAVTVIVATWIALAISSPLNLPVLLGIGLGAYCLGGIIIDTPSAWITTLNVALAVLVIARSRELARISGDHPWMTAVICLGLVALCHSRLFARSTFRRRPFRTTRPFPGRYSLEKSQRYELRRSLQAGPKSSDWRAGYLGTDPWSWVRAAMHETHGFRGWRDLSKLMPPVGVFAFFVLLHAWFSRGERTIAETAGRTIYDSLFLSPHHPLLAGEENPPFFFVMIAIAALGVATALFTPVALNDGLTHPLSRRRRAQVHFRGGLVTMAVLLFVVSPCLYGIGHLTGWLIGRGIRFDFMPLFFRVLMITLILMPLACWGRLHLLAATRRRSENTLVGVIFGVTGFVIAVFVISFISRNLFGSPGVELAVLAGALVASQLIYRDKLMSYYRTTDLL